MIPAYIQRAGGSFRSVNPNVAPLSVNVAASILAQYVSFNVAPAGFGEPGPLQYSLNIHHLEHRDDSASPHCATEAAESVGDQRVCLTGLHKDAERKRQISDSVGAKVRLLRLIDERIDGVTTWLNLLGD